MSKQIRLQYSGFIIFTAQMLSIVTGLVFTLLLTRNMTTHQFGIWTNIFDYTGYFALFSSVLPFWATRFTARGKEGTAKTSTLAQLSIAVIAVIIYLPAVVLISRAIGTEAYLLVYFIAGLYILNSYMITIFQSVLTSMKPQVLGYGLLIEEAVKVTVALVLIIGLRQLFLGAILSLVIAGLVQVFYYGRLLFLAGEFEQKINWSYLKEWLKGSMAMVYYAIGGQLTSFVLILLFLYGGSNTRAYYTAAFTFTNIIGYSASLALALYPKLLAKTCQDEQVGVSFRTVLMLAIPLSTITMVMSVSLLTVLNISYGVAWPVLIVLTINALVNVVYNFYISVIMGVEAFDAEGKISLRKFVRSKIFKVFSTEYIQGAIAIPLVYYVLTQLPVAGTPQAAVDAIAILIGANLSTFIGLYLSMRRSIRLPVAWGSIAKYVVAAAFMGVLLFLLPATSTLTSTLAKALAGFAIYVAVLLAIDKQARDLVRLISEEIVGTLRELTSKGNNSQVKSL
ncbi:MAG: oligosaccharide flippase family protein [Candidatus Bathyarchaeia archaeon]